MIIASVSLLTIVLLLIATWLVGPSFRDSLAARRRLRLMEAQILAEHRIQASTEATLAAMRAAVLRYERTRRPG